MAKFLSNLKDIEIQACHGIEEVVLWRDEENTSTSSMMQNTTFFPCLETLELRHLALLNRVDTFCSYLKRVVIYNCDLVQHIFTFSTLESLKQLKELTVRACKEIQVVTVKEENGTSSENVVFRCLETLILDDLPSLKGFFLGMNEFRWPSLEYVKINNCPQLMMFTAGESKTPKLKYIHTRLGKHSLECGLNFHNELQTTSPSYADPIITKGIPWGFHNLIEIQVGYGECTFPSHALPQLQKLQRIDIYGSSRAKEVFEVVALEGSGFNESQTVAKIPNLTQVELSELYYLKYLWKSNQLMVLEFPNLTTVSIWYCNSLEHVFTCSMVGSLVQLQDLEIIGCANIEIIVKEEEEKECDGKVNEIILPRGILLREGGFFIAIVGYFRNT